MAQSLPPTHIDAQIGDVSGGSQVAVGSYIVQIGRVEGGVVNILNNAPTPPRSRPQPISLRPRAFPGLLDRETETANVIQALESKQSVECSGEPGSGKTSLLRSLAYQPQLASFASGVIYFQVNQQTTADLLQSFFDAFYVCDFPIKPTETEIRHYLQNVTALILLDDVAITSEQLEALMNIAPNCTFIAATAKRSLFGETREVTLKGLPTDEAVNLFQRELGRTLSAEELKAAQSICESLGCIPQRVLRAAHEAREENRSLAAVSPQAMAMGALAATDQELANAAIKPRSEDEKKVLAACAVFYGAPVRAEHVAAVADVAGVGGATRVEQMLEDLEKRGLVQAHNNRYALASDVHKATLEDLTPSRTRALAHFGDWVDKHQGDPQLIAESAEPLLLIMRWAVSAKFWPEVRRLGHGVEAALALSGKWDMWQSALQSILKAAKTEENRTEEAWALHQLGTRALCLGANSEAKASLTDALSLREALNDQMGAAVTRHNLNILLLPPPPKAQQESSGAGAGAGSSRLPSLLKLGVLGLVGLALIGVVVWWIWFKKPPVIVGEVKILSFTIDPNTVAKGSEAQLCYQLENASSVRIEPGVGETKPTSDCLKVSAEQTTTYTLTAVGLGETASRITRQVTLFVDDPPKVRIVRFDVVREITPGGADDPKFQLCYEVRDANHAELDNNGGEVVLNEPRCQPVNPPQTTTYTLTATGSDGRTVTRQVTVDVTRPPPPPPQVLDFSAKPPAILAGEKAQLCFQLKDASSVQIDQSVPPLQAGTDQQCVGVAPVETTVYTLTAFNSEGKTRTRQTTIKVTKPAPQIVSFTAQPSSLEGRGRVRLCYEVRHAERLQIDNGVGEVKPANAGCVDASVSKTTTFTLKAFGTERQSRQSQTSVAVAEAPIEIEFTASPDRITPPEAANLCYRVKEASSIRIDPGVGRLRVPAPGEQACVKVQPTKSTTYTLTAQGSSNRLETRQIQVYIKEAEPKPARIIFFEVLPPRIKAGGIVRLCYGVANAVRAGIAPIKNDIPLVEKECLNDAPEKSTRYVLRAMGEDKQTVTEERFVEVVQPEAAPVRITRFEINPTMVHGTQLCYALENARSARIDPDFGELRNLTADCPRIRSLEPKTFTLTATGQDGKTVQESRRYTPPEPPTETPIRIRTFSPANQSIAPGAPAKICYSTFGEGTAQISPQPGGVPPSLIRRCVTVSPKETTTYTLTVTDSKKQTDSRKVVVTVKKPDDVIR